MNGLDYNHQVFILNGQPVIIQRNQGDGIINDNGSIALRQNSLQESHPNISESNEASQFDINRDTLIQETNDGVGVDGNQFVAYVGDSDEEDVPTIHITLEQAAELGLQFDNEEMKLDTSDLPIVTEDETIEQNKQLLPFNVFSNKNTTVSNEDMELAVFSDRKIISNNDVCDNIGGRISKNDMTSGESDFKMTVNESVVDELHLDDSDQQITLIPHFSNGTITYSVQVNNATNSFTEKQSKDEKKSMNPIMQSKSALQVSDFDRSSINTSSYNGALKSFTTCSDLTSFVESNLDTSNSQQSINSAEILDTASQNIITSTNDGNISFTSHNVSDCANSKSLAVNFTPLSDLLKCNNILNGSKNSNQNNLTNYQPISLTQLINSINKNQNRPQPTGKAVLNSSSVSGHTLLKTGRCANSNSSDSVNTNCKISDSGGASFNIKNSNIDKVTLLKNRSMLSSNPLVLNNANINIVKTVMPTNCDSVLLPINTNAAGKATLVQTLHSDIDGHNAVDNNLTNLSSANASKSIATVLPLMRNHVMLNSAVDTNVGSQNNGDTSTITDNTIRIPSISSNDLKNIDTINAVVDNIAADSNKNAINMSSITERLLNDSNKCVKIDDGHVADYHSQLSHSSEVAATVSPSTMTTTTTCKGGNGGRGVACTSALSTVRSAAGTITVSASSAAATRAVSTSSVAAPLPTVKSIKALDNKCVLPKEVSAALNRLPLLNNTNKPLGSSENPIQLVQQGQTFHSAQALTADQLKQVTTVLQQNNLGTNIPAKNILYDAETNTKIIYRVVYPEEFDLKEASMSTDEVNNKTRKRGRPHKSLHSKDSTAANASDENTVVKRKQPLPRTRSGRLSRPPRYMVRDYKRIKRSELDDSDGAYSDYQSEQEEDSATGDKNLLPGLLLPQKRNISSTFRCPTCDKIYLGYRRMAHHFDKYSDHGTEEYLLQLKKACENKQMPYNTSDVNGVRKSTVYKSGNVTVTGLEPGVMESTGATLLSKNITDDGNTDMTVTSITDSSVTNNAATSLSDNPLLMNTRDISSFSNSKVPSGRAVIGGIKVGAGFGRRRGRRKSGKEAAEGASVGGVRLEHLPQYSSPLQAQPGVPPEQMKTKLRELLELCDVTELVQVAGPAVCSVLTTWELLLLRVDSMSTCSQQNRVTALCDEIKTLLSRFKELAGSLFQPVDNVIKSNCNANITFEMEDKAVSSAFGLPCGLYKINESLLKTEQIINACRSKSSPAGWEDEQMVMSDGALINKNERHSPVIGMHTIIDRCRVDNGLNVYEVSEEVTKEQAQNEGGDISDNGNKDDGAEEDADECNGPGTGRSVDGNVICTNKGVNICNETATGNSGTASLSPGRYELVNDGELLCEERIRDGLDDSVEQIVNEQLKSLTSQNQDLSKVEVDELMKDFSVLEHRHSRTAVSGRHHDGTVQIRSDQSVVLDPSDDLMDGFTSITDQRNHVSASTEDLIKSLENFGSELHNSTCDETSRQDFMNGSDNFSERVVGVNNVNVVDTLDFDVLSQDFHHPNGVNQR